MKQFDVVIAGGAMAGMTLALALNHLSAGKLSIAVVEAYQADHEAHPGFDSRSIALSYGTVQLLKQWQLWPAINDVATAIEHIHISDRSHAGITDITSKETGCDALGYVVELADVGRIYHHKIKSFSNIELLCPDSVKDIERSQKEVVVSLQSGVQLSSKLLVAADGALSTCCQLLKLELTEKDYQQVAVIANITVSETHHGRAFERFTEHGPLALLPMSDNRMSLVWCLEPATAEKVMFYDDTAFIEALQRDFGWRLGQIELAGKRASYPLSLKYREQNISHRFAIVGNAAQTLHPIAGQGFNLGIRDVASLAEEVADSIEDAGAYDALMAFSQRRTRDRQTTVLLTSSLVHVFSNDFLSLRLNRNLGLAVLDNITPLKAPLIKRTLGLVER